jgi:hypothetical protein
VDKIDPDDAAFRIQTTDQELFAVQLRKERLRTSTAEIEVTSGEEENHMFNSSRLESPYYRQALLRGGHKKGRRPSLRSPTT